MFDNRKFAVFVQLFNCFLIHKQFWERCDFISQLEVL